MAKCSVAPSVEPMFQTFNGLQHLAETRRFKAWFLDQFGVLHDGKQPYPGAISTLERVATTGAKMVIISNSSRRASTTIEKLKNLGFDPSLFVGAITSGELTHQYLQRLAPIYLILTCGFLCLYYAIAAAVLHTALFFNFLFWKPVTYILRDYLSVFITFRRDNAWFAALGRSCIHMTWSDRGAISLEGLGLQVIENAEEADFILAHGTEALGLPS
ncbi:hypothetical protein Gogos_019941, partial [Gossypium gossypioides]|nr:hypothetical protein [Gossypium gossypioides]MBA0755116.1 hypothetical protein [Gossypium gossypioides]